ncbi:MAG: hypothetical protein JWL83_729 [Actinomycetia bacterium]|nr:hypothetical protein [Actinomycetes bacterium]
MDFRRHVTTVAVAGRPRPDQVAALVTFVDPSWALLVRDVCGYATARGYCVAGVRSPARTDRRI